LQYRVIEYCRGSYDHTQRGGKPMSDRQHAAHPPDEPETAAPDVPDESDTEAAPERDEGPVRRPLIRATLKPEEGAPPPPRQAPVFTMHEQPRGGAGANRGNSRGRNPRPAPEGGPGGHPNKAGGKPRSSRPRSGSRRGKGRSR